MAKLLKLLLIQMFIFTITVSVFSFANNANANEVVETDMNGSFEQDINNNNLPDFWEMNWRNGTSTGYNAEKASYSPVEGNYHYRLFNGVGDTDSYIYVVSNIIPVSGNTAYQAEAFMRYTLGTGHAEFSIIQIDSKNDIVTEDHQSFNNGGWTWHNNLNVFITEPNTKYVTIRFGVGGEAGAYLDLDKVSLKLLDINNDFKQDTNNNNLPDFWETTWRNGTSTGAYATRFPYMSINSTHMYRLYNGTGHANSFQYAMSNPIPVLGNTAYKIEAIMRYLVNSGEAQFTIIQTDAFGNTTATNHKAFNKGGWTNHENSNMFMTEPNTKYISIRFGIGGEENAYLDIEYVKVQQIDINGGFETDLNNNSLPDFWETSWRNGTSTGFFATLAPYSPADGVKHYRLFNGLGDANSYIYGISDLIPVRGESTYLLRNMMRYTLNAGGQAVVTVIEFDTNGVEVNQQFNSYKNGGWVWNDNSALYTTNANTRFIAIRYGIGGEVNAYLDLDSVSLIPITFNGKNQYLYNRLGRLDYVVTSTNQIYKYNYDRNGNLQNKIKAN